jgi:NRPS condensation-like uncharacterized protein
MIPLQEGQTLGIPNMVNMRRYIPGEESEGFCNLTSMIVPSLDVSAKGDLYGIIALCKKNMDALKEHYPGFHGWSLLQGVFKWAPNGIAKFLISTFFKNPLIGISNIGIIDADIMRLGDAKTESVTITGSIKYPPYMQLSLISFQNEIIFNIANYGTSKDHIMFQQILDGLAESMKTFANAEITEEIKKKFE